MSEELRLRERIREGLRELLSSLSLNSIISVNFLCRELDTTRERLFNFAYNDKFDKEKYRALKDFYLEQIE